MEELFVDEGQVRIVTRHYAFLGDESVRAAEASECAVEQDAFHRYANTLYTNQRGRNAGGFSDERLVAFAGSLSLDEEQFEECLSSNRYESYVERDIEAARELGVNSTPSVFVNGERTRTPELEVVREAIQEALSTAS